MAWLSITIGSPAHKTGFALAVRRFEHEGERLLPGARTQGDGLGRARTQTVQWTVRAWRGVELLAQRGLQVHEAACSDANG